MTLVEYTLASIKTDWPDEFPENLKRVDRDDSVVLDDGPGFGRSFADSFGYRIRPSNSADLERANIISATSGARMRTQTGIGVDRIEAVVEVGIQAAGAEQRGQIVSSVQFSQLVDTIIQVFRNKRFTPDIGPLDPATFVKIGVENDDGNSNRFRDDHQRTFELRFIGERE